METKYVVSLLDHKMGRRGTFIGGEMLILNFGRWEGCLFKGGTNSKISVFEIIFSPKKTLEANKYKEYAVVWKFLMLV